MAIFSCACKCPKPADNGGSKKVTPSTIRQAVEKSGDFLPGRTLVQVTADSKLGRVVDVDTGSTVTLKDGQCLHPKNVAEEIGVERLVVKYARLAEASADLGYKIVSASGGAKQDREVQLRLENVGVRSAKLQPDPGACDGMQSGDELNVVTSEGYASSLSLSMSNDKGANGKVGLKLPVGLSTGAKFEWKDSESTDIVAKNVVLTVRTERFKFQHSEKKQKVRYAPGEGSSGYFEVQEEGGPWKRQATIAFPKPYSATKVNLQRYDAGEGLVFARIEGVNGNTDTVLGSTAALCALEKNAALESSCLIYLAEGTGTLRVRFSNAGQDEGKLTIFDLDLEYYGATRL